jgi:hypothetical protein
MESDEGGMESDEGRVTREEVRRGSGKRRVTSDE